MLLESHLNGSTSVLCWVSAKWHSKKKICFWFVCAWRRLWLTLFFRNEYEIEIFSEAAKINGCEVSQLIFIYFIAIWHLHKFICAVWHAEDTWATMSARNLSRLGAADGGDRQINSNLESRFFLPISAHIFCFLAFLTFILFWLNIDDSYRLLSSSNHLATTTSYIFFS